MYSYVLCNKCCEEHSSTEVETLNIEEDIFGRDIVTFVCPIKCQETKSLVYIKHFSSENLEFWND